MIIALDVGNTRIKSAVFEHDTLIEQFVFTVDGLEDNFSIILQKYPRLANLVVASVGNVDAARLTALSSNLQVDVISHEYKFPFTNRYETPKTLGIDRMVLAAAAVFEYPAADRLIIDAGSCITYDFVDSGDNYQGGAISPGLSMRYQALHQLTARLPLLTPEIPTAMIGNSTSQSMHSGVVNGLVYEVDGFIDHYIAEYPNIIIILTGGDGVFLAKRLKNTIFANSNFLLRGLAQTFQYKSQND